MSTPDSERGELRDMAAKFVAIVGQQPQQRDQLIECWPAPNGRVVGVDINYTDCFQLREVDVAHRNQQLLSVHESIHR